MNIEELRARQAEIRTRLQEIDTEAGSRELEAEARTEWNSLNEEFERNEGKLEELESRASRLAEIGIAERGGDPEGGQLERGAAFHTPRPGVARGEDIFDLTTVRSSVASPDEAVHEMRDRAKRAIERATFPHPKADRERAQGHVEDLLAKVDGKDGALSRRILTTGSPTYERAFGKALKGAPLSADEARALSLAGEEGGFAVPFTLDPTVIPTGDHSVNPYRAISRVESITGTKWQGVSSAGVTASYGNEGSEAADGAPDLAQPEVDVQRAQAFIPFSIEIDQDWSGLQSEMAKMLQVAKDDLEASEFTVGTGVDPHPMGIVTALLAAAGSLVETAAASTFGVADVYSVEEDLGPRFRARGKWLANRSIYNKVRQFDTEGGSALWKRLAEGLANQVPTPGNTGADLIGYPANEVSAMSGSVADDEPIAILGDFDYFLIVDRIGMNVEIVQHLFGANRRPTGQRGIYAIWRNNTAVLAANAFRLLTVKPA